MHTDKCENDKEDTYTDNHYSNQDKQQKSMRQQQQQLYKQQETVRTNTTCENNLRESLFLKSAGMAQGLALSTVKTTTPHRPTQKKTMKSNKQNVRALFKYSLWWEFLGNTRRLALFTVSATMAHPVTDSKNDRNNGECL